MPHWLLITLLILGYVIIGILIGSLLIGFFNFTDFDEQESVIYGLGLLIWPITTSILLIVLFAVLMLAIALGITEKFRS